MDIITQLQTSANTWAREHLATIAMVFTTSLLVIYGDNINGAVKRWVQSRHFLVRAFVFILLCSFGYAFLTSTITPAVTRALFWMGESYLGVSVVAAFVLIGVLADRKRYM